MLDKARTRFKLAAVTTKTKTGVPISKPGQTSATNLQLPQTATPGTIYMIIGLMSLLAGFGVILMGRVRRSHA